MNKIYTKEGKSGPLTPNLLKDFVGDVEGGLLGPGVMGMRPLDTDLCSS